MKRTLLSRLILASLAGCAVTAVQAGQIQASSVSIAREVITTDAQAVLAPSISYRFAGDVDARVQAQTFQIQFTLTNGGTWAALPANFKQVIQVSDGVTGVIQDQDVAAGANKYDVIATGLSSDSKTVFATVTFSQNAANLIKQPIVSINVTANTLAGAAATNVAANRATITNLRTVVGDVTADNTGTCASTKTLPVSFQHFVALTNPTAIASTTNATADEHTRSGHTSAATLITFPTNLKVNFVTSTTGAVLTPGGNVSFTNNLATVASASPATPGTSSVANNGGAAAANSVSNTVRLGIMNLVQAGSGLDSNVANTYALAGIVATSPAAVNNGPVETNGLNAVVTASNGFAVGSQLYFAPVGTNCAIGGAVGTTTAATAATAAAPITIALTGAQVVALATSGAAPGTAAAELCYTSAGVNTIPSSSFTVVGTLVKGVAGGTFAEQNNVCNGTLFSLGGGIKIDVRNYASSKETSGYQSILRIINNSDTKTADVWAQLIHQDGKLGNSGRIIDALAPRAIMNMTAAQIEAKLTDAPAAATAANNGAGTASASANGAPRLRITSNSGSTLRVQNYLFNSVTNQLLEASASQGVDFEGSVSRAPASEGQYQDQDANSGLNLK